MIRTKKGLFKNALNSPNEFSLRSVNCPKDMNCALRHMN